MGEQCSLYVNQGNRDAEILARIGNRILVEYDMPAGTTALVILEVGGEDRRSISYNQLPLKWLRAIVEAGNEWIGKPQKAPCGMRMAKPSELLARRTRQKEGTGLTEHHEGPALEGCADARAVVEKLEEGR